MRVGSLPSAMKRLRVAFVARAMRMEKILYPGVLVSSLAESLFVALERFRGVS